MTWLLRLSLLGLAIGLAPYFGALMALGLAAGLGCPDTPGGGAVCDGLQSATGSIYLLIVTAPLGLAGAVGLVVWGVIWMVRTHR